MAKPETHAEFSWDTALASIPMPSKASPQNSNVDAVKEVVGPIRLRMEQVLTVNTARVKAAQREGGKRVRVDYEWRVQPVPDADIAKEFTDALDKYAKYRPGKDGLEFADPASPRGHITARYGDPSWYVNGPDGVPVACEETADGAYFGVRYSVRPPEVRKGTARLPGTAQ